MQMYSFFPIMAVVKKQAVFLHLKDLFGMHEIFMKPRRSFPSNYLRQCYYNCVLNSWECFVCGHVGHEL